MQGAGYTIIEALRGTDSWHAAEPRLPRIFVLQAVVYPAGAVWHRGAWSHSRRYGDSFAQPQAGQRLQGVRWKRRAGNTI